jgi:hypothetical protein
VVTSITYWIVNIAESSSIACHILTYLMHITTLMIIIIPDEQMRKLRNQRVNNFPRTWQKSKIPWYNMTDKGHTGTIWQSQHLDQSLLAPDGMQFPTRYQQALWEEETCAHLGCNHSEIDAIKCQSKSVHIARGKREVGMAQNQSRLSMWGGGKRRKLRWYGWCTFLYKNEYRIFKTCWNRHKKGLRYKGK